MNRIAAHLLAEFLTQGEWTEKALNALCNGIPNLPGRRSKWRRHLIRRIFADPRFSRHRPAPFQLANFLHRDEEVRRLIWRSQSGINEWAKSVTPLQRPPARMAPIAAAAAWKVPEITSSSQLAEHLNLSIRQLDWLADCQSSEHSNSSESLRNYHYEWIKKSSGGYRLLEAPKQSLKRVQRWIADDVLANIPVHDAAHAFRPGRSPRTSAEQHQGRAIVLRIDLRDFFPSITSSRIAGIFRMAGYPGQVTRLLTGLCTTTAWQGIVAQHPAVTDACVEEVRARFCDRFFLPHLPQGAPTSPALSNLATWKLDCRLTGLAHKFSVTYTRYADDLVFSGDRQFGHELREFRLLVCAICIAEGFEIRHRKTLIMRHHQQQQVTGVVVNQSPSVSRRERDRLKAILHNCRIHGVASQSNESPDVFRSRLAGKIAWVTQLNPKHGAKLQTQFDQIVWN